MFIKAICCDVFRREMYAAAARSVNMVDLEFLPKGLHDIGSAGMRARLQEVVDRAGSAYDAIVLAYGLCNNGLVGVKAPRCPIVMTRAHDCMTLFLGGRSRYLSYFMSHPGTYFKTSGWIERAELGEEISQLSIQHRTGMDLTLEEMIDKYGEDNGRYLYETLCNQTRHYRQLTYIPMGIEPDDRFERAARQFAQERGWKFAVEPGDMGLIQRLFDGDWESDDFLTVPSGFRIVATHGDDIVGAQPDGDAESD
jgi:hypothetical protein